MGEDHLSGGRPPLPHLTGKQGDTREFPAQKRRWTVRKPSLIVSFLVLLVSAYSIYSVPSGHAQVRTYGTFIGGLIFLFALYGVGASFPRKEGSQND